MKRKVASKRVNQRTNSDHVAAVQEDLLEGSSGSPPEQPEVPVGAKRLRSSRTYAPVIQKPPRRVSRGGLKDIMNIPVEIASHLEPADLVVLTRTNRRFRAMLLQVSSKEVWRHAEANVPGLPRCPRGMTEPRYAAYLFSKHCTLCGCSATSRPDPYLRVRLCASCRQFRLVDHSTLSTYGTLGVDKTIIFYSKVIKPNKSSPDCAYSLVDEIEAVLETQRKFIREDDEEGLFNWVCNRRREVAVAQEDALRMDHFIKSAEAFATRQSIWEKKEKRRIIIERLKALGWTDDDMIFDDRVAKIWNRLMDNEQLVLEDCWVKAVPSICDVLNQQRELRIGNAECKRLQTEIQHLYDRVIYVARITHPFRSILNSVGIDLTRPLETFPYSPEERCISLRNPFPSFEVVITWEPFASDIEFSDLNREGVDKLFNARRARIENSLWNWRSGVERQLVEKFENSSALTPSDIVLTAKGKAVVEPELSLDTLFLLRADTVFKQSPSSRSPSLPQFYPGLVSVNFEEMDWTYQTLEGYRSRNSDHLAINPSRHEAYIEAHTIARSILAQMGMPNATHFELLAMGRNFECARCPFAVNLTWSSLIHHYVVEDHIWKTWQMKSTPKLTQYPIVLRNTHDLSTSGPLARIIADKNGSEDSSSVEEEVEYQMVIHLQDAHDISNVVENLHYGYEGLEIDDWGSVWDAFYDDHPSV
ncbi:hypothetical protein RhiJN_00227 [Ceratobasidium sp. AG-Ba]|nr:hypothetical protein RhiJN_00227 [Ceratobasidium sp. AG-Ba]